MARRIDHTKDDLPGLILGEPMKLVDEFGAINITARKITVRIGHTAETPYVLFGNLAGILRQ